MRNIVDLPKNQIDSLASICRREGISRAEAVRQAVATYTKQHESDGDDEAFGIWRDRKIDGVALPAKAALSVAVVKGFGERLQPTSNKLLTS